MALLKLCETVIPDLKVRPYYRNKLCKQDHLLLNQVSTRLDP